MARRAGVSQSTVSLMLSGKGAGRISARTEAAVRAAAEQRQPGDSVGITYEDETGRWHADLSAGDDRPYTRVED